jgi:transaldolase
MSQRLQTLAAAGVSIWLDDLSRERLDTGNLADLVKNRHVVGVTTNPTIFASALANGSSYQAQITELASRGADAEEAIFELTTTDVRRACDILHQTYVATGGVEGRVSIEVSPPPCVRHQHDRRRRPGAVARDRPSQPLVKIHATDASLPAIAQVLGAGISVNVTLIFGMDRYRQVLDAYLEGLERAQWNGLALDATHSVASFFVSRLDTEVDSRLRASGGPAKLRGTAAVANARLAYTAYQEAFPSNRFAELASLGLPAARAAAGGQGAVSVEAAVKQGWREIVREAGRDRQHRSLRRQRRRQGAV